MKASEAAFEDFFLCEADGMYVEFSNCTIMYCFRCCYLLLKNLVLL